MPMYGTNRCEVTVSLQDLAPYSSEANHLNEQDLPKRSSDDTKNEVCDQGLLKKKGLLKKITRTQRRKMHLLHLTLSYLVDQHRQIKAFLPFNMVFMTHLLNQCYDSSSNNT